MTIGVQVKISEGLTIVFEDEDIVVIDKPSGLLSVPGRGEDNQDCVVNRLKAIRPEVIEQPAVHRLDMETSGLLVMAKTKHAHKHISRQFQNKQVAKTYIALVEGIIDEKQGKIELAFRLDPDNRPFQVYDEIHGKLGKTLWQNLGIEGIHTRIQFMPITGRTHQLRLHSMHPKGLSHPIVGDCLYGSGKYTNELKLHATKIQLFHPSTEEAICFDSTPKF